MSERPSVESCRSCGEPLSGVWCHACGQGHRHVRLSMRELGSEAFEELTSLDTRFIRTARMLTRDPGRVCREYLSGRRVPWMHPFKYALVMASASFLVQRLLFNLGPPPESELEARAMQFTMDYGLILNFLLLPLWAALTRLIFFRAGLRWIEHYVVALYGFGHLFLLQTCFAPLSSWGASGEIVTTIVTGLMPVPFLSWLVSIQKLGPPGFGSGSVWIVFRGEAPWLVAKADETGRETRRHGGRSREQEFLDGNWLAVEVFGARWRTAIPLIFLAWFGLMVTMAVPVQLFLLT